MKLSLSCFFPQWDFFFLVLHWWYFCLCCVQKVHRHSWGAFVCALGSSEAALSRTGHLKQWILVKRATVGDRWPYSLDWDPLERILGKPQGDKQELWKSTVHMGKWLKKAFHSHFMPQSQNCPGLNVIGCGYSLRVPHRVASSRLWISWRLGRVDSEKGRVWEGEGLQRDMMP